MPINGGVGEGIHTPRKLDDFKKIVEMHIRITLAVMAKRKYAHRYHYLDLTAGNGYVLHPPRPGCALVFLEAMERLGANKLLYRADFIDRNETNLSWCPYVLT